MKLRNGHSSFPRKTKSQTNLHVLFFPQPKPNQKKKKKSTNLSDCLILFTSISIYPFFLFSQKYHTLLLPLKKIRPEKLWILHVYVFHFKQLTFPLIGKTKNYHKTRRGCKPICRKSSDLKDLGCKDRSSTISFKGFTSTHSFPLHPKCKTSSNFQ